MVEQWSEPGGIAARPPLRTVDVDKLIDEDQDLAPINRS